MNNVAVHEFNPGNNGLIATKNIKAGDVVLFIPDEAMMNEELTLSSPSVKYFKEQNIPKLSSLPISFIRIALYMLDESRNPYSEWTAFLATQPQDLSSHFSQLKEEDIELMKGSILYDEAKNIKKELE